MIGARQAGIAKIARSKSPRRESDHIYRKLLEGLPAAFYATDAEGYLTFYNEAAATLWRRRPKLGTDRYCGFWKLFTIDGTPMPHHMCPMAIALKENRAVRCSEVLAERPDGTRVTFIPHPAPLQDGSGRLIGATNMLVDISERKQAERALRRQAGLIELSFDAILAWRQPGGIEFWNKGASILYGFEPQEALGKVTRDLLQTRHPRPWAEIEAELREHGFWEGELRHTSKKGEEVFVASRYQLVSDDGDGMLILETNRDITGRKRAQAELSKAQEQLESDLRNMTLLHEVSMRFVQQDDLNGLLEQILDAAIGITGADKGNIQLLEEDGSTLRLTAQRGLPKRFLDFFSRVHKGQAACGTVLETGERVTVENVATSPLFIGLPALEIMLSAGCLAVQSTPLLTRYGRLVGILSTHKGTPCSFSERDLRLLDLLARQAADSIERFQSDERLNQSRRQLQGILESAMDAIISTDAQQRIILFNTAAEHVFRCPASEAIGTSLERFIPKQFRARVVRHMRRFRQTGGANRKLGRLGTLYGLRADGEEFPIEASISQVHLGGQHIYTVILRDITDRLREEATLRRQVELLHLSHDAIFAWSEDDGIQFWSKGAAQLYGYVSSEVLGIAPRALFKDASTPWQQMEAELHERGLWEGEFDRVTKAGRAVVVSSRLQLVSARGARTVILETDRDITERRRLQQEVLEILGAEQRRIGQDLHDGLCQHLAGTEFRAAVISSQLEVAPEAQREIVKIGELIREGARQARMLSRGLSPVSLEAEGLMSALKELAQSAGDLFGTCCRFECAKSVAVPDNVVATHLYRIAQEAISNAARHGRAKRIVVALEKTIEGIQLSIRDDGCGFRVSPSRARGMGLHTMRYRAELIGATLTIDVGKGSGARVTCLLSRKR
jgi:PAS domain S-box-containing protein